MVGSTELSALPDRAQQRAEERERRARERAQLAEARNERRAAEREQASREREARREAARLEQSERLASLRPAAASDGSATPAAPKRRATGSLRRTGEARIERDTRAFRTVIDEDRIRALSARGTSVASLASVFGLSVETIEAALSGSSVEAEAVMTKSIRHDR